MKAYVITTGILFAAIALAHLWEVLDRQRLFVSDVVVWVASLSLVVWAWRLARSGHRA